jgi:glycosyltransferase involved in cell wall biosynthesis
MKFCIITHVNHHLDKGEYFAYAPYVREMNIWLQHVDEVIVVAPLEKKEKTAIDIAYLSTLQFYRVPSFNFTNITNIVKTLFQLPMLLYMIFKAMKNADHIHLRCPGNMGLLGCLVQIAFPKKSKTAKYAGNWDLKAKQPWSYRLQKWILNNTFLTKNIKVLVYGEWEGSSRNILPFFTATYSEREAQVSLSHSRRELPISSKEPIRFMFVGTLSHGKRPLYALSLFKRILESNSNCTLDFYGEGIMRQDLEQCITENGLSGSVVLHGNQSKETVEKAYQNSHFLILASQSEGWPKVVAEAMFWGCVPIATSVSCVPMMLDQGNRGMLLTMQLEKDILHLETLLKAPSVFRQKSEKALSWSRQFTMEKFDAEIQKLLAQ